MDPVNTNKISSKTLLIAGGILLFIITLFSVITLLSSRNATVQQEAVQKEAAKIAMSLSLTPSPTYIPPADAKYYTVDSVNFLPHTINDFTIDTKKVEQTAKQKYTNLNGDALVDQINKDIFTWLALNTFYSIDSPNKVSSAFPTKRIDNISAVTKEIEEMKKDYDENVMKLDGYYLKIRYRGTLKINIEKLRRTESTLQPLAQQLINSYRRQAVANPNAVLDSFNNNNTVKLLNNREVSKRFSNYPVYPPLVGDVNYDSLIRTLPVGEVSDIITLRTKLNGSEVVQDYAYAFFYLTKKTGSYLPVEALVNNFVKGAEIN